MQAKSEFLLDKISERLGVPKPADGFAFAPERDALAALRALAELLTDPKAARARIAEYVDAVAKADEAVATAKTALADRDAALADLAEAEAAHEKKLADSTFNHERDLERSRRDIEALEAAAAADRKEAAEELAHAKELKAEFERKLAAVRQAAA